MRLQKKIKYNLSSNESAFSKQCGYLVDNYHFETSQAFSIMLKGKAFSSLDVQQFFLISVLILKACSISSYYLVELSTQKKSILEW